MLGVQKYRRKHSGTRDRPSSNYDESRSLDSSPLPYLYLYSCNVVISDIDGRTRAVPRGYQEVALRRQISRRAPLARGLIILYSFIESKGLILLMDFTRAE